MSAPTTDPRTQQSEYPDADEDQDKDYGWEDFLWLMGYAKPLWWLFSLVLILSFLSSGAKNGIAFTIQPFIDQGLGLGNWEMVKSIVTILAGLAVASGLFQYYFLYVSRMVREKIMVEMRTDVFERLLNLPLSFYSDQKQGDIISRVTNDIQVARQALHSILTKLVKEPVMAIFALGVALTASVELTVIAIVIAPLIILPIKLFAQRVRKYRKKSLLELGDVVESLSQILSGLRVVRIFQAEEDENQEFRKTNENLLKKNLGVIKYKALSRGSLQMLVGLLMAGFIAVGAWLIVSPEAPFQLTQGAFLQFIGGIWMLYRPTQKLTKIYNRLQETLAGVRRIRELLDKKHLQETVPEGSRQISGLTDQISIRDMSFAYDSVPVLKDIDLDINQGEVVALVGPSGAGKSTLMDIVARFYHPQEGQITIDGQPIEEIDLSSYIDQLSIVSQDAYLFNTTIENNIRYGNPDASHEEVENAAKMAYIHDFITSLPDGYDTRVGERGVRVSGGQKQRITIARAILEDPELLLLDEATSDLDTQSEHAIQKALDSLLENRTCIVIAHRLSTIQDADHIVVLDEGHIVQEGTHDELIQQDGLYSELYESQFETQEE